ncbi:hypothetical protein JW826_00975 [Candidatus Woesearchaeota archaeon]|nr:hypothetical protein [Candidatus Woesearchaeota archaeon]
MTTESKEGFAAKKNSKEQKRRNTRKKRHKRRTQPKEPRKKELNKKLFKPPSNTRHQEIYGPIA